jgi:hypothetical protein
VPWSLWCDEAISMALPVFLPSTKPFRTEMFQHEPAPVRPEPVLRRPTDITLGVIFAELSAARAETKAERGAPRVGTAGGPRADRLLMSLEACARALAERNLPIPPSIRDELRLRRALWPTHR